jgi:hypothetical protein
MIFKVIDLLRQKGIKDLEPVEQQQPSKPPLIAGSSVVPAVR